MKAQQNAKALLKTYRAKRDFKKTTEPSGENTALKSSKSLQFCVQKHLASHLHYDFRLEHNGVLLSWAVPKGPSLNPSDKRLAMHVEDHPTDYGDFEGVIPSGYGAGIVMLWDTGTWKPDDEDIDASLKAGSLKFSLDGVKLKGSWALVRLPKDEKSWLLIKHKDEWAGELDIEEFASKSVKSGGGLDDILRVNKEFIDDLKALERHGEAGKLLDGIIASVEQPPKPTKRTIRQKA